MLGRVFRIVLGVGLLVFAMTCLAQDGADELMDEVSPSLDPAAVAPNPGRVVTAVSQVVDLGPSASFVFYLHGTIIEQGDRRPTHPRHGIYEYDLILERLATAGLVVISEQRPAGTRPDKYAARVVAEIKALMAAGASPDRITVVGFSKGSVTALYVSNLLAHDSVGFVFMAGCGPWMESASLTLRGRLLSLFERSDDPGSCRFLLGDELGATTFEELELSMGGGHGAFYAPRSEWFDEVVRWSRRSHDSG